jgi:hypothetical protein
LLKHRRVGHPEAIHAERAKPHRTEFAIANGDGLLGPPTLPRLDTRGEEVHVALERGLEQLVPVHEVRKQRHVLRDQRVQSGPEGIGRTSLIHEEGELGFPDGELGAALDFHVPHGEAVHEHPGTRFGPLDDIDELLAQEIAQRHGNSR